MRWRIPKLIARVSTTDDGLRTPHAGRENNNDDFARKSEACYDCEYDDDDRRTEYHNANAEMKGELWS
jgi:hypothetical protein